MELHQLEALVAVGKEHSFSRAARLMRISRSAISRKIKRLEDELSVTLVRREFPTISLTLAGCSLFLNAQRILSLCAQSIETARERKISNGNDLTQLDQGRWRCGRNSQSSTRKDFSLKIPGSRRQTG
jgi:DNA-binding transcriptional LysR family regulator